jgi:hypothetical protein
MRKTWFIGGEWRLPKRSTHAALQTQKFAPTAVWIVVVAIGEKALSKDDRPMLRVSGRRTLRSEAQYAQHQTRGWAKYPTLWRVSEFTPSRGEIGHWRLRYQQRSQFKPTEACDRLRGRRARVSYPPPRIGLIKPASPLAWTGAKL